MAKYLKKFENHSAYSVAESSLILPNVSLCVQENDVHYNPLPSTPMIDGHEYVDLGLPSGTKWATMNVGASSETDYGNYYQYGKGAAQYAATSGQSDYSGTENPLATSADTVAQVWGGQWHMPTQAQLNELTANTTFEMVENYQGSGIKGATFTANEQTLFIPYSGIYNDGALYNRSQVCYIWSSTPDGRYYAYYLYLANNHRSVGNNVRVFGYSVRGVVG